MNRVILLFCLSLFFIFSSCEIKVKDIRNYGYEIDEYKLPTVKLDLSKLENFKSLVDKINERYCTDTVPKIILHTVTSKKNIFLSRGDCIERTWNPPGKHYVTYWDNKFYQYRSANEVNYDSLASIFKNDFAYFVNQNTEPSFYLIIIEAPDDEKLKPLVEFLIKVTDEFDSLNSDLRLTFHFWTIPPIPPPPPPSEE